MIGMLKGFKNKLEAASIRDFIPETPPREHHSRDLVETELHGADEDLEPIMTAYNRGVSPESLVLSLICESKSSSPSDKNQEDHLLQQQVEQLKSENELLRSENNELKSIVEGAKHQDKTLKQKLQELKEESTTVRSKYRTLKQKFYKLKSEHVELSRAYIKKYEKLTVIGEKKLEALEG